MGSLGGLLGTAGGAAGTGFKAPGSVPIQSGVDTGQLDQSYGNNQNALASQQALLQALQNQQGLRAQTGALASQQGLANQLAANNGIGAQGSALSQQQALNQQLAANNGAGNVGSVYAQTQGLANQLAGSGGVSSLSQALGAQLQLAQQQQGLAQQYQNIALGQGPNPAQAMLNQQTGQNVANQAALMAGQRGAGANVGLIARQAAQQGANTQQQAVGQGATMQANQSLNALQGLGAQQQAIGNTQQNVANIAQSQIGLTQAQQNALAAQAANQVGMQQAGTVAAQQAASNLTAQQQAQQAAIANQANTLAGQEIAGTQTNTGAQQAEQQILQNANAAQNNARVGMQSNINAGNAGLASKQMEGQQGLIGGGLNSAGAAAGLAAGAAKGGLAQDLPKFANGGISPNPTQQQAQTIQAPAALVPPIPMQQNPNEAQSSFGKFINGPFQMGGTPNSSGQVLNQGMTNFGKGIGDYIGNKMLQNADEDSDLSKEDTENADADFAQKAKGGMMKKNMLSGGDVKADSKKEKAVKSGNSYDNDKIPAYLSEGEIVIPRSVTQSSDPVRGAADFVAKVLAKRRV